MVWGRLVYVKQALINKAKIIYLLYIECVKNSVSSRIVIFVNSQGTSHSTMHGEMASENLGGGNFRIVS